MEKSLNNHIKRFALVFFLTILIPSISLSDKRNINYVTDINIDIDENNTYDALTDGLLILRFMFGLSGESLVSGALGANAEVTSATAIESKLEAMGSGLDIDQDGEVNALTDGLLILRFLFGLTDSSLTSSVLGQNAQRTNASDISDYLTSLVDNENTLPNNQPNIILIISDDMGLDSSSQYNYSSQLPTTPFLDGLAENGLVFDNVWATPACTPTRSSIITGKYGVNTGVTSVGDELSASHKILQQHLKEDNNTVEYVSALVGKWHLGGGSPSPSHPNSLGLDYYAGHLRGSIQDYENWQLTINGETTTSTTYHTTAVTDIAIDWINEQNNPWFLWLAYAAPHMPFHLPPAGLHSQNLSGSETDINANPRNYYLAAIEAMDTEIGRMLENLDEETLENTTIIFIGDNGTPGRVRDRSIYANGAKGTLYEGGLAVPMIISGAGVNRVGERDDNLISSTDLFATIIDIAGGNVSEVHDDSVSFASLLKSSGNSVRAFSYSDYSSDSTQGWAIRNKNYKLISTNSGQQLFNLATDPSESLDLIDNSDYSNVLGDLVSLANEVRANSTEPSEPQETIDITNKIFSSRVANCQEYIATYSSSVTDVFRSIAFTGDLVISGSGNKCILQSNGVPNHNFNDGNTGFPNDLTAQNQSYEITATPEFANTSTYLRIGTDNGLMLNGVKIDLLAAACFGVGNERTGCFDMDNPWRFDPMHPANGFRVDSHNAHVQPNGSYHYHGSPNAMFNSDSAVISPVVGFAADGFPIFGSWFDDNGVIRKAQTSYRLKSGDRESVDGYDTPSGSYDGKFRQDYEFVEDSGDLDECNGMTKDGVYGYYITEEFPYILACLRGQSDATFE